MLIQQKEKSHAYQVDQLAFAKARLFDILIWDLDRHEGQWDWAEYLTDSGTIIYKPIPKDRDYAFYQYADGLIPWLLTRRVLAGKIKPLIHNIPDVEGLAYKGRKLDKHFLNQVSAEEWDKVARELKVALTGPVIQEAMDRFPNSVKGLAGQKIGQKLAARVEKLPEIAREYYYLLAKKVTISGSEKKEKFVVRQNQDKTTLVEVFSVPENAGELPHRLYHRVFPLKVTRQIILNGLGNQDEFEIDRISKKGPVIKIINESVN